MGMQLALAVDSSTPLPDISSAGLEISTPNPTPKIQGFNTQHSIGNTQASTINI